MGDRFADKRLTEQLSKESDSSLENITFDFDTSSFTKVEDPTENKLILLSD